MNNKDKQKHKTDTFSPIELKDMDQVQLMNRTDTKYWFHTGNLQKILNTIHTNYYLLHIDNKTALPYSTVYYDTEENRMFTDHHNGKLNRYKVRKRCYVSSGISFLEVKFKNNKGRTIKNRIPSNSNNTVFTNNEHQFLKSHIPFSSYHLHSLLINNFSRMTLVNRNFKERCTIDFDLQFQTENKNLLLDDLVIVEIKSEGSPSNSPLALALRNQRIKTSGFSKYCIGRVTTDNSIKRNAFKQKIRTIEKLTKQEIIN